MTNEQKQTAPATKTIKTNIKLWLAVFMAICLIGMLLLANYGRSAANNVDQYKQKWESKDKQHQELLKAKGILDSQIEIVITEKLLIEKEAELYRKQIGQEKKSQ